MPTYTHASSSQLKAQSSALAVDNIPDGSLCVGHARQKEDISGDAAICEFLASLCVSFPSGGGKVANSWVRSAPPY